MRKCANEQCDKVFAPQAGERLCWVCRKEELAAWQREQRERGCEDFSSWYGNR